MKERKSKINVFFALVAAAIIILSAFVVITQYQVSDLTTAIADEDAPPFVEIFVDESSGTVPFEVNFTSLVLNIVVDVEYDWEFGDGETSDEINPTHTYQENGSYVCNLTVTYDNGEQISDTVEISANANQPPIAIIAISETKSNRDYIPILPQITFITGGRFFCKCLNSSITSPILMKLGDGKVTCEAQVTDPERDEIVSYEWELQGPNYQNIFGSIITPTYYFEGKNITFPLAYIYRVGEYDITLTVTDAAGNKASIPAKFNIDISQFESQVWNLKNAWNDLKKNFWHDILKTSFRGPVGNLLVEKVFPSLPNWPLLKLFIISYFIFKWDIPFENVSILELIGQRLEKHPFRQKIVKNLLESGIDILESLKQKASKPNMQNAMQIGIDILQWILKELGLTNIMPELSDENPPDKSKSISITCPRVAITVTDTEGDPFNVSIHGDYVNDIYLTNQSNGTFTATLTTPLPDLTDICWHVNVDSQGRWVNETYQFRTW